MSAAAALSASDVLACALAVGGRVVSDDELRLALDDWSADPSRPLLEVLAGRLPDERREQLRDAVSTSLADETVATLLPAERRDVCETLLPSPGEQQQPPAASAATLLPAEQPNETRAPSDAAGGSCGPSAASPGRGSGIRYAKQALHAKGGLGAVYVAKDEELGRTVALKEIQDHHADHSTSRARFVFEAEITGQLEHPGIVPVYGLGAYADGRPYYAMRFIHGHALDEVVKKFHAADVPGRPMAERSLALRELLGHFVATCNAIAYAHSKGVIHRDLKPANVMVGEYGETLVVDWGLAKQLGQPAGSDALGGVVRTDDASGQFGTVQGAAVGTPGYMPPEQALGEHQSVGAASDVYALGATLYHLLTGQTPLMGLPYNEVFERTTRGRIPPARQANRRVPAPLEAVCKRAMAVDPAARYASAKALAEDVEHWLADEPVSAYREPWTARLWRWGRRHKGAVGTATAAAAILATVAIAWGIVSGASQRAERQQKVASEMDRLRVHAQQQEALARRYLYVSRVNAAGQAWRDAKLARMDDLLEQERPSLGRADLRGFEWHYLQRTRHGNQQTIAAHKRTAFGVAFSPDGERIVSGSSDMTARVWRASDGQELFTLPGHAGTVHQALYSSDGRRIATACVGRDNAIRLWDAKSGKELRVFESARQQHHPRAAFSPDGQRLIGTTDAGLRVWDATAGETLDNLRDVPVIHNVSWDPSGDRLACYAAELVFTYDLQTRKVTWSKHVHTRPCTSLAYRPDGKLLASAS